jgi:Protein of unknown function (DUF1176)
MLRNKVIAFGIFAVLLVGSAGAKVEPEKTRYFKNWAAGCDNGLSCEAVTMAPSGAAADKHEVQIVSLALKREIAAKDALTLRILGFEGGPDRYRLLVDEKLVDTGAINRDDQSITILGKDALKVARALVRGKNAKLVDAAGQSLGEITLNGSAAALRYIDGRQRYAGSVDAIAAMGRRKARIEFPSLPIISAKRINDKGAIPEAADLVALAEGGPCTRALFDVTTDSVHSLGNNSGKAQALALINCGGGPYNQVSKVYIGAQNAAGIWRFEPARFDYGYPADDKKDHLEMLANSVWDAKEQRLYSTMKGRIIGDCGFSVEYVWDGIAFRIAKASEMKICQGAEDWITTWRADVQFVQ